MKERQILFTPTNAQLVHDSKKTQTRRIIKPQPYDDWNLGVYAPTRVNYRGEDYPEEDTFGLYGDGWDIPCPYVVGDRLWIREAYCVGRPALPSGIGIIPYYGTLSECPDSEKKKVVYRGQWGGADPPKWRSAIHMPRWACRTVLEIVDVKVERLQEITQLDALYEGCDGPDHKASFYHLWESIHGEGSWARSPYVWVIEFKRMQEAL